VLSAVTFAAKRAPRFGIESDQLYDLFLWIIPIGIIGCRVYFVACSWDYYRHHLDEIIKIWNGGIAMYGGIIFGSLTALVWARIKKIPAGAVFDIIGCSMPLGASIGRWANFINERPSAMRQIFSCVWDSPSPREKQSLSTHIFI
jgi:phosphatidylglycerol:prolipoprotein diacylglycerol transferase